MTGSARFGRADRVVSGRDYDRMRRHGRRLKSKNFIVSVATRHETPVAIGSDSPDSLSLIRSRPIRLGLTVSRRVGNAVVRNRVKRAVREWFRVSSTRDAVNLDIVVIARPTAAIRTTREIGVELDDLLSNRITPPVAD
ncbi:MAG: ribonuclease P protein component [Myxococcota bacterium]|jgi:ribonuclease P protein component